MSLGDYLEEHGISSGIEGIDTRAMTLHLRSRGAMQAIISTEDTDLASLKDRLERSPGIIGIDLVKEVTCDQPYTWAIARTPKPRIMPEVSGAGERPLRVVAYDYGVKRNILRILTALGCEVTVVPASTRPARSWRWVRTASFSPTGRETPRGCLTSSRRFANS